MSTPRTKPWEVSSGTSSAAASGGSTSVGSEGVGTGASNTQGANTQLPERPTSLTSDISTMNNTSPYGNNGYGSSYGSYGSRYGGGYGSSMYGGGYGSSYGSGYGSGMYGMGGYGSGMYGMGGYGSGMYGMGGYGNSMYGMGGGMYGQPGGTAGGLAEGTQATFQLIESVIGAVGGFAQMLEATYMATHSSFFTMMSVAEQFGNLKNALGSLLGIFALIKFVKKIFYKLTGKTYNYGINAKEFQKFEKSQKLLEENIRRQQSGRKSRISFKPLLLFLAASIGFPYLLTKVIQKISEQQQRRQQLMAGGAGPNGAVDPSNLLFAKALYEFNPENPNMEIELKPNELVAILSKQDPTGAESQWWKVRSRLGKVGYVPLNYLEIIQRRKPQIEAPKPSAAPEMAGGPVHELKFDEQDAQNLKH